MPCVDGRENWTRWDYLRNEVDRLKAELENVSDSSELERMSAQYRQLDMVLRKRTAYLCGIIAVLEKEGILLDILDKVDYEKAGITKSDIVDWWKLHKQSDKIREDAEKNGAGS